MLKIMSVGLMSFTAWILVGCAGPLNGVDLGRGGVDDALTATGVWSLVSLTQEGVVVPIPVEAEPTLRFSPDRVYVSSGCNKLQSECSASNGSIKFHGDGGATEMGCPYLAFEDAYFASIMSCSNYVLQANNLVLTNAASNTAVVFSPSVPPVPGALVGSTWKLVHIEEQDGVSVGMTPVGDTLNFTLQVAPNRLTGTGVCNKYMASVQFDEAGKFEVGVVGGTKKHCGAEKMKHEAKYLKSLSEMASYAIYGNQLTLTSANGAISLVYETSGKE